ncbi:aromatic acid exporter family protein [Enterococcus mundtii]|nr:aromatic acid exporter family protein [Enterococcus mundtii]
MYCRYAYCLHVFYTFGLSNHQFQCLSIIFIPIAVRFKLTEGIVVNSVLITHYLSEQSMSWQLITNEAALMIIGVGFALLSNVYMPDSKKRLKENQ